MAIGTMAKILVQAHELLQAVNEMNQAMEIYDESVEACKTAAADLASKWAGQTRDAFVAHQENAYSWYKQMLETVREMINLIRQAVELYQSMEDAVTGIMKG